MTKGKTMSAAGRSAPASLSSKKRKLEGVQKYYAVRAGKKPGVYLTYAECQAQTAGFKGAMFKSFLSRQDAEAFAAGKKVQAASDEPEKFYAVAVGSPTGIYNDWAEASEAIKGVKGPKYRRFGTRAEAVEFIREFGSLQAYRALGEAEEDEEEDEDEDEDDEEETPPPAKKARTSISERTDGALRIYTDGSSLANGKQGAKAGLGVFFGNGDPRNLSERLKGEPQTNQRAELTAISRALQVVPKDQAINIVTDSQYSINCITQWSKNWVKKDWKTAGGGEVKNKDIIVDILDLLKERTDAGGKTNFEWVKGHATDPGNVAADMLAVRGAKMPTP